MLRGEEMPPSVKLSAKLRSRLYVASALCGIFLGACQDNPTAPRPLRGELRRALSTSTSTGDYTITQLATLGGVESWGLAINSAGDVVGKSSIAASAETHATLWPSTGGAPIDLGTVGTESEADAINDRGDVVGFSASTPDEPHATLWPAGATAVDLGPGSLYGIQSDGTFVGYSVVLGIQTPTVWAAGGSSGSRTLDAGGRAAIARAINSRSEIAGYGPGLNDFGPPHAIAWPSDARAPIDLIPLYIFGQSFGYGINANGDVVGASTPRNSQPDHATLWPHATAAEGPGAPIDLGTLGGSNSVALGVNSVRDVVGYAYLSDNVTRHAVIWTADGALIDLPTLGGSESVATGINDVGEIVGYARDASGNFNAVVWKPRGPSLVANAGGPYSGAEGSQIAFDGSASTGTTGQDVTYTWSFGDGTPDGSGIAPVHTYADNGTYIVTLTLSSGTTTSTATSTATISNVAPSLGAIAATPAVVAINTAVNISASFTDPGTADTHEGVVIWDDGTSSLGDITENGGAGSVSATHAYSTPGVYQLTVTVTDDDGGSASSMFQYVVVYDPTGGFVTGGGWINSPPGAYTADPSLVGRANFGFVSRYQKGANVPTGDTEFQFETADFSFSSTSYDWLVIAGASAKYKGSGTINGAGDFAFMLTAVDRTLIGRDGVDRFRIKIWDKSTGQVIYDNQPGADDSSDPPAIGGGSIVIHK
jgi:probable HAF family extracellular repeat protein